MQNGDGGSGFITARRKPDRLAEAIRTTRARIAAAFPARPKIRARIKRQDDGGSAGISRATDEALHRALTASARIVDLLGDPRRSFNTGKSRN